MKRNINRNPILDEDKNPYLFSIYDSTGNNKIYYGVLNDFEPICKDNTYILDMYGNVYRRNIITNELIPMSLQNGKRGYKCATLYNPDTKKNKSITVHRLMKHVFFLCDDPYIFINHKDLNKHNNHLDNLEITTCLENTHHAILNNAMKYKCVCITDQMIDDIREWVLDNPFQIKIVDIIKRFKISTVSAVRIIHGYTGRYSNLSDISYYLWLPKGYTPEQIQEELYQLLNDKSSITNKMNKYVFKYDLIKRFESELERNNTTTKVYGRTFYLVHP